jgi:hypothetical protein
MESSDIAKQEKRSGTESIEIAESQPFDQNANKKLLRKLDWHIIPFMSLIYL